VRQTLISLCLLGLGCPVTPPTTDGAVRDQGMILAESGLARCARPGEYCDPADPCGLSPVCSAEGLCETSGRRDCDDGIACTRDRCIAGGCENVVQLGYCLIDEVCHQAGETAVCGRCEPETSRTRWTPVSGTPCDDNNLCTKGDECRQGICVGQVYSCNDGLGCTTDACDGVGGCNHYLKAGQCLIEQVCYQPFQADAKGCNICDPTASAYSWTVRTNICEIDGLCYPAGAKDPSGCAECDPQRSPSSWSLLPNRCLIGATCAVGGTPHPTKCALCNPKLSTSQWTPGPGAAIKVTSFSTSLEGYTPTPLASGVGWQRSTARFTSPPASLYYGNLTTKTYDLGMATAGAVGAPPIALPAGQRAYLTFQLYLDVSTSDKVDVLSVIANGTALWTKSAQSVDVADYGHWIPVLVELTSLAGQTVTLQLAFDAKASLGSSLEGVYVDDVTVLMGCGPAT
jgi:hypothetical protein